MSKTPGKATESPKDASPKDGPRDAAGPFAQWLSALQGGGPAMKAWEGWLNQQMDRFLRSEPFLGQVGKALEGSMLFKAQFDRLMEQSLRSVRMPAMSDFEEMVKRFDQLERRIDQLSSQVEALQRARSASSESGEPKADEPKPRARKARGEAADTEGARGDGHGRD